VTPIYPLAKTLASINMDGLNPYGPTSDVEIVGYGASDLDDVAKAVAMVQGRVVKPEAEPEKGGYYRSDHFPFARQGVPALNAGAGQEHVGKPAGYGKQKRDEYTAKRYHAPSDEIQPDWDVAGMVQDCEFYYAVGLRVANASTWPQWAPGNEFKAVREAMLKAAGTGSSR
jgi:Zn-dependent M28 family amino/carboxypeptidase